MALFEPSALWKRIAGRGAALASGDLWSGEVPFHWAPVLFGLGVALYFGLPVEPPQSPVVVALGVLLLLITRTPRESASRLVVSGLLLVVAGFALAQFRAQDVAAPAITYETRPIAIEGRLESMELRAGGVRRLTIAAPEARWPRGIEAPARIRVSARTRVDDLRPGDRLRLLAVLMPPPEPVLPGAYDFSREAWFKGLGGTGYAVSAVERVDGAAAEATAGTTIRRLRDGIERRIRTVLPGDSGAVAVALIAGIKGDIPEDTAENMRRAGLAHLLAISGLHMALVTGIIFFAVRALLAGFPYLALHWPLKKIAATAAWGGALAYLVISGAGISTQRAFIMVSIVLLAAFTDRQAVSIRNVALAGLIVLVLTPEALLSASFQMSFAAVIGLIAGFEYYRQRVGPIHPHGPLPKRAAMYLWLLIVSTVIAELSIGPVAAYHFHRVPMFGVVANIAAMPLMSFWIMPWGVLALVLMPLGLEGLALQPMGWGIDLMLVVAADVSAYPGAVTPIARWPLAAFALVAAGFLMLALFRHPRLRLIGLAPIAVAAAFIVTARQPDVLVSRDGDLFAVRGPDGRYYVSSGRRGRFAREVWQESFAQEAFAPWAALDELSGDVMGCDSVSCIYRANFAPDVAIAFVRNAGAFPEDCRRADIVISALPAPAACGRHALVLDGPRIGREGALTIYLEDREQPAIRSSAMVRGRRPWTH